jgi:hypothetical protein
MSENADRVTVRRRERTRPARSCVMKVYLSTEERDVIRAGAIAAGMTPAGFAARAALDAAAVKAAPAGARNALERLAGLQLELIAARRQLALLRNQLASGGTGGDGGGLPPGELERRCAEAAERLARVSGAIHRQLEGGL